MVNKQIFLNKFIENSFFRLMALVSDKGRRGKKGMIRDGSHLRDGLQKRFQKVLSLMYFLEVGTFTGVKSNTIGIFAKTVDI